MKQKSVLRIRGYARPAPAERFKRYMDRQITTCQEWLEGPDRPVARLTSAIYVVVHLILRIFRGG